ncbi:MAG: hypothetical protein ACYC8T_21605 [Myxococcaceae bacterium]
MRLLALAAVLAGTGCATSISTMQLARPVEPKHFQVTGGWGIYAPLGTVGVLGSQAVKQAQAGVKAVQDHSAYSLSETDQQELLTSGISLAVLSPGWGYEMSVRTGVVKNLDVGLRYNVNSLRLDTKYRLLHHGNGLEAKLPGQLPVSGGPELAPAQPDEAPATRSYDLAIGLGVSRYFFSNVLFKFLEYVKLDDFSRWDFEVPIYLSAEFGQVFKVYGAPKYIYSRTTLDEKLVNYSDVAADLSGFDLTLPSEVHTHFVGSTIGIAVGYKWVHVMLEMTGGYSICNPVVFGKKRYLGGVTLQPAIAVNIRI